MFLLILITEKSSPRRYKSLFFVFERSEIIFGMRSALKSLSVSLKRMFRKINGYGSDTVNDADKYVSLGFRKKIYERGIISVLLVT